MSLVQMPPELLAIICSSLPLSTIAALERTCRALCRGVSQSGVWAARARRVDKAKSYNYVTRALSNVREKNVRDQKVFKVLLAVRKMIKAASFAFFWEMMEKHAHNQLFRHCGQPNKFDVARQRFLSRKISQFKALSSTILEAEQYDRLDNHSAFCCEASATGGVLDVADSLQRIRIKVKESFAFNFEEAALEIQKHCAVLNA